MLGQTLGHYRIVEKIGAGGMGVVYRAHDERLDRDVAIKVLPPGALGDEAARKRFHKEALALAKLTHPNIGVVHDFGSEGDTDYLVMELIPGSSLAEKLAAGPLSEKEVAALGVQIAAALEEAHEHGVIHRDLKPGNIVVTPKGQAKVLDFGLAKLLQPAGDPAATQTFTESQAAAGTLPYMAPEQLRGEAVDARTDLYAFGLVQYEMVTGRRPFHEQTGPRLTDAILHQTVPPPSRVRLQLSADLERVILKCLEKDPENRYQSAKEVGVDLRRLMVAAVATPPRPEPRVASRRAVGYGVSGLAGVALVLALLLGLNVGGLRDRFGGGGKRTQIRSLAVLPLANLSNDPEQQFFVDGMHDELIGHLSKIGSLKVISRTSVIRYKDASKSAPEIGKELGVEGLVEGSVSRAGNRVAIRVQLIRAATDEHIWAETFQRELTDVLTLQSEIAKSVAQAIGVALTPAEQATLGASRPVNPAAYEAFLAGRQAYKQNDPDSYRQAIVWFQKAIALDPKFALAHAELARAYLRLGQLNAMPRHEAFAKGEAEAQRAVELDSTPETRFMLLLIRGNTHLEFKELLQAAYDLLAVDPNSAIAHRNLAQMLCMLERHDEAIAHAKEALELDPFALLEEEALCLAYRYARRLDEAEAQIKGLAARHPGEAGQVVARKHRAYVLQDRGDHASALTLLQRHSSDDPVALAYSYARVGRVKDAGRILADLERKYAAGEPVYPTGIALLYASLGERDQAFTWIDRGFDDYDPGLWWGRMALVDPAWDPVRSDPRFQWDVRRRRGEVKGPYGSPQPK